MPAIGAQTSCLHKGQRGRSACASLTSRSQQFSQHVKCMHGCRQTHLDASRHTTQLSTLSTASACHAAVCPTPVGAFAPVLTVTVRFRRRKYQLRVAAPVPVPAKMPRQPAANSRQNSFARRTNRAETPHTCRDANPAQNTQQPT